MPIKVGNVVQAKVATITRSTTTDTLLFTLPANAMVIEATVSGVISNAATTATVTLKSRPVSGATALANFGVADVKANAYGHTTLIGIANDRQSEPQHITGVYAETGTASTSGGPYTITVRYL